ncbi:hypothetical protein JS521_20120 [Streptomyces sp. RHZ10]|uniref:DUF6571 domain-containing protein n=2 Tax=Streptomyces durocortorensis TaxID=2811104 RepID=A0ABS2HZH9_9ACTN|nr:hypothetical protein [Streptomyces durocortorensis]
MLTYSEVMTTDLGKLTTAADKWDHMAAEIKKVETRYQDTVGRIRIGQSWSGVSATGAGLNFAATRYEYAAAQTQAKAIASLLRDAHDDFVRLKRNLENQRAAAIKAGMKVSEGGVVTYDYSLLTDAERAATRHDPDYAASIRTSVESWSKALDDCVKAVDDADRGVKIALEAVTEDGYGDKNDNTLGVGFNAHAKGDVEEYEAANTAETAMRLNNGEKVSAAEIAEFQRSVRDNSHDKRFSETLLNSLGPDGLIKTNNKLNDRAYDSDTKNKSQYLEIQKGLANTVATATRVPGSVKDAPPGSKAFKDWVASDQGKFYREWTDKLDKSGTENFGKDTHPVYGYQSFVSLMRHADTTFDDQFLYELGHDLIALDKDQPQYFRQWGAAHDGVESDPLDGLLGVMSKNPDAATAFFDPDGVGSGENHVDNSHMEYLVGHGEDAREWPKVEVPGLTTLMKYDDPSNKMGLGLALEAAATGHQPAGPGEPAGEPGPHTDAQARVMQGAIETLDAGAGGEEIHANLQKNLGRAIADYAQDNHHILAETGTKYGSPEGKADIWGSGSDSGITVGKDSLMRVMRGVSADDQTYALLQDTQRFYAMDQLSQAPRESGEGHETWKNPASELGAVTGAMNSIGSDVILDERDGKVDAANDMARYGYHLGGAPITGLPVFGDTAQRLVDLAAYEWSKDVISAAESAGQEKNSKHYASGVDGTYVLIDAWAQDRGVNIHDEENTAKNPNWDAWQAMRREAKQSYSSSRGDAAVNLGWD